MEMRKLGSTGIEITPLVLGGNVFGWTADRDTCFAILDAFLDAGFNAIDTADVYNRYAPGLQGGESETIIGDWMADRGVRDRVVLITKGGLAMGEGLEGLGREYLPKACEASLKRLRTDYIDVYLSHAPDPNTPIEETLEAFAALERAGKIRSSGCSNYPAGELRTALAASGGNRARYAVVQPMYNLAQRDRYEGELEELSIAEGLGVITYYALAAGFLTGKYRRPEDLEGSNRGHVVKDLLNGEGLDLLARLDKVAARHGATPAQTAIAWVMARPSVTAPIASATSIDQLRDIIRSAEITLTPDDIAELDG